MGGFVLRLAGDGIGDVGLQLGKTIFFGQHPDVEFRSLQESYLLFRTRDLGLGVLGESLRRGRIGLELVVSSHLRLHDRLAGLQLGHLAARQLQGCRLRVALLLGESPGLVIGRLGDLLVGVRHTTLVVLHLRLQVDDPAGDPLQVERGLGRSLEQRATLGPGRREGFIGHLDLRDQLGLRLLVRRLVGKVAHRLELLGGRLVAGFHGFELFHHVVRRRQDRRVFGFDGLESGERGRGVRRSGQDLGTQRRQLLFGRGQAFS